MLKILCIGPPEGRDFAKCFGECAVREFGEDTVVHFEPNMRGALREIGRGNYDAAILENYLIPTHDGCRLEDLQNPAAPAANVARFARVRGVPFIALVPETDVVTRDYLRGAGADFLPYPCLTEAIFEKIYAHREISTPFPVDKD